MKNTLLTALLSGLLLFSAPNYDAVDTLSESVEEVPTSEIINSNSEEIETEKSSNNLTEMTSESIETTIETITEEVTEETTEISDELVEEPESRQVDYSKIELNKYVSLNKEQTMVYKDLDLEGTVVNAYSKGQTFLAKEQFTSSDNKVYYSLFDEKNQLIGYVLGSDVTYANNKGGVAQPFKKYATVKVNNGSILADFDGKIQENTSKLYKQTLITKEKYHHVDGTIYYSVYNNKDQFLGYFNEKDIDLTEKAEGVFQPINEYATMTKNNYTLYRNFEWKKKFDSKQVLNKTFLAKGEYHHFNGKTYYSIYTTNNSWYGYVEKSAMTASTNKQGPYFTYGKYISIKPNSNGSTMSNFNGQTKQSLKNISGKTYFARGAYHHSDGNDYYSIYDQKNRWQGYVQKRFVDVSAGKQGKYQAFNRYITVTKNNYTLWQDFNGTKKGITKNLYMETFHVKGLYHNFNGSTYYSVYNSKGKWQGYLNASGANVAAGPQGIYQAYGKQVTVTKSNYKTWSNFSGQQHGTTNLMLNKQFTARGKYHHFKGARYLSLYDSKGKWYGYLNENATSQDAEKMAKVQTLLNTKYKSSNYGIHVMSLSDGSTASMNSNKVFNAASTGKLPAMYYTQKMINQKKLDPNRKYQYTDAINQMPIYSYGRGGAGILQNRPYGSYYSLDTMLHWTAKYSDNQGANFLGYYGANKFESKMRNEISSIIGHQWTSPFRVTAKDNALMMEAMYRQGGQVMTYMQDTVFDSARIPKYLPVKVAHKVGDVNSYRHDVGVVYAGSPYVLSVLTQNYTSYEMISLLSKDIYNIMK